MRRLAAVVLFLIVGCGVVPPFVTKPTDMSAVPGGISNVSPFFGNYKLAVPGATNDGLFLLASCGCGDWRVLFKPDNGSAQTQFAVHFYTEGDYKPTGMISVYGQDGDKELSGTLDQDSGLFSGRAMTFGAQKDLAAMRGSSHEQPVEACGLCHIGSDSIFPLPDWHPQKYKENPNVCFECHTTGDTGGVEDP